MVLLNNSADSCPVFSGKGLEHTVSHYIVEVVEDGHIVCEPVVVVQSTDFCVVLVQDFQIIQVQQAGAPDRFPNLFISVLFVVFNLEGMIGEQPLDPLVVGDIEHDFSVVYSSGGPGFGLFVTLTFGDCDLIPQELSKIMPVGNQCFFLGHFQMKIFPDEAPHILFDLFRVRFSANYSNQKIIGVPNIENSFIAFVHLVAVRY